MSIEEIKKSILSQAGEAINKIFGQRPELFLIFPPDVQFGDFTIECFSLAKQLNKSPEEIAKKLAEAIQLSEVIEKAEAVGSYVNIKVPNILLFGESLKEIFSKGDVFGNSSNGKGKQVMVEYLGPNTNKPLHLGHVRNGALGMAVSRLLELNGYKIIKANIINDRGVHICKSMLAWKKWANGATPESTGMKPDHFVGEWYIRYGQEENKSSEAREQLEKELQEMLQKWEAGEPEVIKLWEMMNLWVYKGFDETYKKLGLEFDAIYYESKTYKLGKDIIQEGLKKGVFYKTDEGAVVADLPIDEFGKDENGNPKKVTLLRADGTSLYITQDLATAKLRFDEYKIDKLIYVVAAEQNYHFQSLFRILEMLGFEWAKNCEHLSYGMVYLPEGKMKSREGKVVDADGLIDEMVNLEAEEIRKRYTDLPETGVKSRAAKISLGAIKFYLLRVRPIQDIYFDPKESISLEGFTGPYCQYAYVRTAGILRKAEENGLQIKTDIDFSLLGNKEELALLRYLIQLPDKIELTAKDFNLSRIAEHIYETAKTFNQFYTFHPVINAENKEVTKARLALVKAIAIALKKGLKILGIEILEEM